MSTAPSPPSASMTQSARPRAAGESHDAVDQRLDRRRLVRDVLPHDLVAVGPEHHDPVAVPSWVDPDDQALRHLVHLRADGLEVPHDTPSRGSHLTHMSDRPQMSIR